MLAITENAITDINLQEHAGFAFFDCSVLTVKEMVYGGENIFDKHSSAGIGGFSQK